MTDLDPLLREAMTSVPGPVGLAPSLTDIHRRARRHNRRRIVAALGVAGCGGLLGVGVLLRHQGDGSIHSAVGDPEAPNTVMELHVDDSVAFPARCSGVPTAVEGEWVSYDRCVVSREILDAYLNRLRLEELNRTLDVVGAENGIPADTAAPADTAVAVAASTAPTGPVTCDTAVPVDATTPVASVSPTTDEPTTAPATCRG
jgi:hypothetical protein